MPLPSSTDLATLDIAYLGQPFVQVEAKNLGTETLDITYLGQPFVAASAGISNVWVNVSGTWKQASAVYVNINGTWKTATMVKSNISTVWK